MEAAAGSGDFGERRGDFANRVRDKWVVGRDGAGNRADDDDQSGRLPRSRLRAEQFGDSRELEQTGLLVSQRVYGAGRLEGTTADADVRGNQLRGGGLAEREADGDDQGRVYSRRI